MLGSRIHKLLERAQDSSTVLGVLIDKLKFSPSQLHLLSRFYTDLVDVAPLQSSLKDKLHNDLQRPELDKTFTKVVLWSLLQYDKILYLDSDTLPIIPDSPAAGSVIDLLQLEFEKSAILAAPDSGFPDIFNSGVFVLKPNLNDYSALDSLVKQSATNPNLSFDGADQGLLNQYFNPQPDWVRALLETGNAHIDSTTESGSTIVRASTNWVKIPFLYNVTPSAQYQYLPAFKHFLTLPPVPVGPEDFDILTAGGEPGEDSEPVLRSTFDTLANYHTTALSYINYSTTQVKLVHFIGPAKPWKLSTTVSGIHKDWWYAWMDTFGPRSIADVVSSEYEASAPESLHEYTIPKEYRYEGPDQHLDEGPLPEPYDEHKPEQPSKPFEPSDLLDPANYQQYEDHIVPSADAMWDPTKEPPPSNVDPAPYAEFEQEMKAFTNTWDAPQEYHEPEPEPEQVHYHPEPQPEPYSEPPPKYVPEHKPEPVPSFAYTKYVEPERVFDSSSDYFPQHRLQEVERIDIEEENSFESNDVPDDGVNAHAFIEVNEKLSHLGFIEDDKGFEDIYDESSYDQPSEATFERDAQSRSLDRENVPKLFPWEFRNDQTSERVFDF